MVAAIASKGIAYACEWSLVRWWRKPGSRHPQSQTDALLAKSLFVYHSRRRSLVICFPDLPDAASNKSTLRVRSCSLITLFQFAFCHVSRLVLEVQLILVDLRHKQDTSAAFHGPSVSDREFAAG